MSQAGRLTPAVAFDFELPGQREYPAACLCEPSWFGAFERGKECPRRQRVANVACQGAVDVARNGLSRQLTGGAEVAGKVRFVRLLRFFRVRLVVLAAPHPA